MENLKKMFAPVAAVSVVGLSSIETANAALNAGVASGFTSLETDALALVDLVWPVTIAITIAFIILALFKKAASAAI